MGSYTRILLATDFSESADNALDHAAVLAARAGAELHVLNVKVLHDSSGWPPGYGDARNLQAAVARAADQALQGLRPPFDVPVVRASANDVAAAPAILRYADEHGVDLIVVGTHGHKALAHVLLGSEASAVARAAKVPVLVVGRGVGHRIRANGKRCILAPTDFSEISAAALRHAALLAREHDTRLVALHVMEPLVLPPYYPLDLVREVQQEQGLESLRDFVKQAGLPEAPQCLVHTGRAHRQIVAAAGELAAGLIVMSTDGASGMDRLIVGSVADRVLRTAPCPVLVYREGGGVDLDQCTAGSGTEY